MDYLVIGASVVTKKNEEGTIVSFDERLITVQLADRTASFLPDAFEKGFLRFADEEMQCKAEKHMAQAKAEEEQARAVRREEAHKAAKENKAPASTGIVIEAVTVRLDAAPVTLPQIMNKDKGLIQAVFAACDKETDALYALFKPEMAYLRYTSQARSKYHVGFLTKHLDTYVFRVFSREDIYKKRVRTGVMVMESDTTEILRVLYIRDKLYYFSKNISTAKFSLIHTAAYSNWHSTVMAHAILLNNVIRVCDCGYLNEYIAEKDVPCLQYLRLLFLALHNNKAEIVFKNRLFLSTYRIENLAAYLEEFSPKQIDFASKHDVINTLPMIKKHGLYDVDVLKRLEMLMVIRGWRGTVYEALHFTFRRLGFDISVLDRKLINFLRRIDHFNASIYNDYIYDLSELPGVTVDDFFDNNYIERHTVLSTEKNRTHDQAANAEYAQAVKKWLWIDREDNGFYICVPKTIEEFKYEGDMQHNCVYTNGYYRKVIDNRSIIVFLRKSKDVSYVTVEYEYETFMVLQALGKYNARIDKDLYAYIEKLGKQLHYEMLSQQ